MKLKAGHLEYDWVENWAQIPPQKGWAHHGLAVTSDGKIVSGGATIPEILIFSPNGHLERSFPAPVTETHGLTISPEDGQDLLWVVSTGEKYGVDPLHPPRIVKCALDGTVLATIERDAFNYADDEPFAPTALSVDPNTGSLWVADGYGSHRVHRFSASLEHEVTIDGTFGAGAFKCPHWVFCRDRGGRTEIYVADRANDRIQVFSPDGTFLRCLKEGLVKPSAFAVFGQYLVVAELTSRLVILDANDQFVGELGEGRKNLQRDGWPNRLDQGGLPASPQDLLSPGLFNSPHGIAADAAGNIYVSEWMIGDRYTKLRRLTN